MAAQEGRAPAVESCGAFRRRILSDLAPWQIEPTELFDYLAAPTAPARSTKDWFERVLPSSLVKAIGSFTGVTAAKTVGTMMAETSLEQALGKLSPEQAALEDLKAVAGLVPAAAKGTVKGIPGFSGNWRREWATDPVGTALGLLAVLGVGEGAREGAPYLSGRSEAADFLTTRGIPAGQVDQTFKAIEKARATGGALDTGSTQPTSSPEEKLDFPDDRRDSPESGATFGQAATNDYRSTFFDKYPELRGKVKVHHAVEKVVLNKFPGVVTKEEIHSIENLRGIPDEANARVHLSQIRREWNRFYDSFIKSGTVPTKTQLLHKAAEIDSKFGSKFMPPAGGG